MIRNIYAIYDKTAEDTVSSQYLLLFPHDAPAVRTFTDIATSDQNNIGRHLEDFDLICLGALYVDDGKAVIKPENRVVLTGTALRASFNTEKK